jgi:hypothetical protein
MILEGAQMKRKTRSQIKRFAAIVAFVASPCTLEAGSATWNLNPVDNLWHNAANWTPATVPNGDADTASFGPSDAGTIRISKYAPGPYNGIVTTLDEVLFEQGANSFTIRVVPVGAYGVYLVFDGEGIVNSSGVVQDLVIAASGNFRQSASLGFNNSASAGENIVITNQGGASADGSSTYGAYTVFLDSSTAAMASEKTLADYESVQLPKSRVRRSTAPDRQPRVRASEGRMDRLHYLARRRRCAENRAA